MGRWLAVREEWQDVRYGKTRKSGGFVVGQFILRTPLGWLDAATRREAEAQAPLGTTAVLSFLSLDVSDRLGWLKMPLGATHVTRVPLFEGGEARRCFDAAEPKVGEQLELVAA